MRRLEARSQPIAHNPRMEPRIRYCKTSERSCTPGEILVSDVVRQPVAGKNFLFSDRGEFVPKGFDDAVHLYEVQWRE